MCRPTRGVSVESQGGGSRVAVHHIYISYLSLLRTDISIHAKHSPCERSAKKHGSRAPGPHHTLSATTHTLTKRPRSTVRHPCKKRRIRSSASRARDIKRAQDDGLPTKETRTRPCRRWGAVSAAHDRGGRTAGSCSGGHLLRKVTKSHVGDGLQAC